MAAPRGRPSIIACGVAAVGVLPGLAGCGRSPVVLGELFGEGGDGGRLRCGALDADYHAQTVIDFDPTASGGQWPERTDVIDPEAALGPPDHMPTPPLGTVSIGDGGVLTLGFGECRLTTDGTFLPDLFVYEAGFDERVTVQLRPTAATFAALSNQVPGTDLDPEGDGFIDVLTSPAPSGAIDVDEFLPVPAVPGMTFDALRIVDVPGQGLETVETPGADIDAIELVDVTDSR